MSSGIMRRRLSDGDVGQTNGKNKHGGQEDAGELADLPFGTSEEGSQSLSDFNVEALHASTADQGKHKDDTLKKKKVKKSFFKKLFGFGKSSNAQSQNQNQSQNQANGEMETEMSDSRGTADLENNNNKDVSTIEDEAKGGRGSITKTTMMPLSGSLKSPTDTTEDDLIIATISNLH
ncbi:hypothetical protein RFI_27052, partial [Reticulomyxa filosa]